MAAPVYLNLSRKYGLPYWAVLCYADYIEKQEDGYWNLKAVALIADTMLDAELTRFLRDMRIIMLQWAEMKAGLRDPFTGELYALQRT